jgi:hypothetical protein
MYCGGGHLGFPIGIKNRKLANIIKAKLYMNVHWMVLYKLYYVFCYDMKFKLVATAGLSLTLDPMGKMFQNASSLKPLGRGGGHLGFPIGIKNRKLVKNIPMIIYLQFGFSQFISFREEDL